jgi:hypothetical protein
MRHTKPEPDKIGLVTLIWKYVHIYPMDGWCNLPRWALAI